MTPRLKKIAQILRDKKKGPEEKGEEISCVATEIFNANCYILTKKHEEAPFIPTRKEVSTKDFIRKWMGWFETRLIHFEDWQDICEEGLALTLKFIESDLEDATEMEGYKDFMDKVDRRIYDELPKSDKYTEFQKRCWDDMGH